MDKSGRENLSTRMKGELKKILRIQAAKEDRNIADLLEDGAILYLKSVGVEIKTAA